MLRSGNYLHNFYFRSEFTREYITKYICTRYKDHNIKFMPGGYKAFEIVRYDVDTIAKRIKIIIDNYDKTV